MKRQKRKFDRPLKLWNKARIEEEKKLLRDYGLRRKHEIWRSEGILRNYRRIARNLEARRDKEKEKILLDKLFKMGLIKRDAGLDDVLALTIEKILDRRLQTLVFKKGLANTLKQARQYIVHGHIAIDSRKIAWPSTVVEVNEEGKIGFYEKSKIKLGEKIEKKS
jgi:small subunit ribosomal protein S4